MKELMGIYSLWVCKLDLWGVLFRYFKHLRSFATSRQHNWQNVKRSQRMWWFPSKFLTDLNHDKKSTCIWWRKYATCKMESVRSKRNICLCEFDVIRVANATAVRQAVASVANQLRIPDAVVLVGRRPALLEYGNGREDDVHASKF